MLASILTAKRCARMGKSNPKKAKLAAMRAQIEEQNELQKEGLVPVAIILFGLCFFASWLVYSELDTLKNVGLQWLVFLLIGGLFFFALLAVGFMYANSIRCKERLEILDAIEGYKGHELHEK